MRNFDYCVYTYRHRVAFKYVVEKIVKDDLLKDALLKRAEIHDMDKMSEYLVMSKEEASHNHRMRSSHHIETGINNKFDLDLYEMLIDFECAGYTKPDKPLCAYDFINVLFEKEKINKNQYARFQRLMNDLNIADSHNVTLDKTGMDLVSRCNPTEKDILNAVNSYSKSIQQKGH